MPPRAPDGFRRVAKTETCSDCIERNAVDLLGRPRTRDGGMRLTAGCSGCGGSGRQLTTRTTFLDPYWTGVIGRATSTASKA